MVNLNSNFRSYEGLRNSESDFGSEQIQSGVFSRFTKGFSFSFSPLGDKIKSFVSAHFYKMNEFSGEFKPEELSPTTLRRNTVGVLQTLKGGVGYIGSGPLFLARKVSNSVSSLLGFSKEVRLDHQIIAELKSKDPFTFKVDVEKEKFYEEEVLPEEPFDVAECLSFCSLAASRCIDNLGNPLDQAIITEKKTELQRKLDAILDKVDKHKISYGDGIEKIRKEYINFFVSVGLDKKEAKQLFNNQFSTVTGENIPEVSKREFTVGERTFTETLKVSSCSVGASYLAAVQSGDEYQSQIDFIQRRGGGASRISAMKKDREAQGMTINFNEHNVKEADDKGEGITILRHGATAVHGEGKVGLAELERRLDACRGLLGEKLNKELAQIKKGLQIEGKEPLTLEKLESIITNRRHLVIAQQLPVLARSIELSCQNPIALHLALSKGSFLHVARSNLSDLDKSEKSFLEDTEGGFKYLEEHTTVKFKSDIRSPQVEVNNKTGVITLLMPSQEGTPDGTELRLQVALFSMGVNEKQTFGMLGSTGVMYQDKLNSQGFKKLWDYVNVKEHDTLKKTVQNEISSAYQNATGEVKNNSLTSVVNSCCRQIGCGESILCKSGKDRTSADTHRTVAEHLGTTPEERSGIRSKMSGGLSFILTKFNTGFKGYAFNTFQALTMPWNYRVNREHHATRKVES